MLVKDLMNPKVLVVREDDPVADLLDALVGRHIHGAPVVDAKGELVGMVSQLDVHFGTMTRSREAGGDSEKADHALKVREIMTAPAVHATEETPVADLCKMMHRLRIHRVPVVRGRKVIGVISSLDICGAVGRGEPLTASAQRGAK
jgi:CBS domain-containing protein